MENPARDENVDSCAHELLSHVLMSYFLMETIRVETWEIP